MNSGFCAPFIPFYSALTRFDQRLPRFRTFGTLRYARITADLETGRSRGTGFVCFWRKEDADKAIEQSELLKAETGVTAVSFAFQAYPGL